MRNSLYVLLDANIIIEAHMQGVWASLMQHATIILPSIVMEEANGYYDLSSGDYIPIHLESQLALGKIQVAEASLEDLAALRARFDPVFLQSIHRGESEALALLLAGRLPDARFCAADGPAVRALSLLQMSEAGISFESVLQQIGFQHRLRDHFSERWFREMQERGAQEFIRGEGLRKSRSTTSSRTNSSKRARRGVPRRKR